MSEGRRFLLTFFGEPALWINGAFAPLALRYQKSGVLLAYLVHHPGRMFERGQLAEHLWPDQQGASGRANLRVVLADAQAALRRLGLAQALDSPRETLSFRETCGVLADGPALKLWAQTPQPSNLDECSLQWLTRRESHRWLAGVDGGLSSDLMAWLDTQRSLLDTPHSPALWRTSADVDEGPEVPFPVPMSVLTERQVCAVLVRIEFTWREGESSAFLDQRLDAVEGVLDRIDPFAGWRGGQRVSHDDLGGLYVFGLEALHAGVREDAVQFARHLPAIAGPDWDLCVGMVTGPLQVTRSPQLQVSGWRSRLVDRLALHSDAGWLVCDSGFLDLAGVLGLEDLGSHHFRGFTSACRLLGRRLTGALPLWAQADAAHPQALIGRKLEMQQCQELYDRAEGNGTACVCISGLSGVGKSRLAFEWAQHQARQGAEVWRLCGRPERAEQPWAAWADLFDRMCPSHASSVERAALWSRRCRSTIDAAAVETVASLLCHRHVAEDRVPGLQAGLIEWLSGSGGGAVPVIVVDDVHWVDADSLALLSAVACGVRRCFGLVLVSSSTPGSPRFNAFIGSWPRVHHIELAPLPDDEALVLLDGSHGESRTPSTPRAQALQNARGLPLYLTCPVDELLETGHFAEYSQAMFHRLGPARTVVEMAAMFGLLFHREDLQGLFDKAQVGHALDRAVSLQLLVDRGRGFFAFFHRALRDGLLRLLPHGEGSALAAAAAGVLENRLAHAQAAALWALAGEEERARQNWHFAAEQAWQADDVQSALHHFEALAHLGYAAERVSSVLRWRRRAGHALAAAARHGHAHPGVWPLVAGWEDASEDLRCDPALVFQLRTLRCLAASQLLGGDARAHASALVAEAGDPVQQCVAACVLGQTLFWRGEFDEAIQWLERSIKMPGAAPNAFPIRYTAAHPLVWAHGLLAWLCSLRGLPVQAACHADAATAWVQASCTRLDACVWHGLQAWSAWTAGDAAALLQHGRAGLDIAETDNFEQWQGVAGLQVALGLALTGSHVDADSLMELVQRVVESDRTFENTALLMAADALRATGQTDWALQLTLNVLEHGAVREHRWCWVVAWRIRFDALTAKGLFDEADACRQQAFSLGMSHGFRGWLREGFGAESQG